MPPAPKVLSPSERLAALETQGGVKKKGLLRKVAEFGEKPLWEAPQRWGQEFSDYLTEGDQGTSLMDSPYERAMRKVKEAAGATSRATGSTVSSLTSPTSLALTAATMGLATPEIAGANVARGTAMALKGAGALQAAHGAYKTGKGLYEGDIGETVAGGLETGMGALGARTKIPAKEPLPFSATPKARTGVGGFSQPSRSISPSIPPGGEVSGRLPPSVSAAGPAMREVPPTTTYPTPSPRTLLGGQESQLPTPYQRALGAGNPAEPAWGAQPVGPRFTGSQFGVADRGLGPVGVVEKGSVVSGAGPSVSQGMGIQGPGQAAFEALVPERYKSPLSGVTPEGLTMNLRGEPPPAPTPGLRTIGPNGMVAPKGTISLEDMIQRHGSVEAAAEAARMTPQELLDEIAASKAKNVTPKAKAKKAPAPPKPAAKVEPKVEVQAAPAPPAKSELIPGEVRMFEKSPVDTLQALAKRGNAHAIRELALRGIEPQVPPRAAAPIGKGKGKGRLFNETGAVGGNIDPIIERQAAEKAAREGVPTRPSESASGWDEPSAVAEREAKWQQTMSEMNDRRMRDGFENAINRDPDSYANLMDETMQRNPDLTPDQAHEHLFNRHKERLAETARLGDRKINVDEWGKVNPEWEKTPFRPQDELPDITEESFQRLKSDQPITQEKDRMIPSKDFYAGQEGIDRAQVERVKAFGPNDPAMASELPPRVFIDENGNYQIYDGHHRMTAALEKGEPIDMMVEDAQPMDSWARKTRGMKGDQSPFAVKGKQAASAFQQEMEAQAASGGGGGRAPVGGAGTGLFGGGRGRGGLGRITGETGAVGRNIDPIIERNSRNAAARASGRGVVSNTTTGKVLDVAEEVARTGMLGGLAPIKSGLGGVGAHIAGAAETKSLGPLKSLMDLPAHGRNFMEGWRGGHSPEGYGPMSKINFIGRAMGAGDYAMEQSLIKGGVDPKRASELMLNAPNALSTDPKLNTRLGRFIVPFKTIPYNAFTEGMSRYQKHPYVYGGAALAGAGLGAVTKQPEDLSLGAAAAGPYSFPFAVGAGFSAGARALQGTSPLPEWAIVKAVTDPLARYTKPAISRWIPGINDKKSGKEGKRRDLGPSDTKSGTKRRKLGPKD